MIKKSIKKGFTLIEILVVMVLISFLLGMSMTLFDGADSAKERLLTEASINDLAKGLKQYINDTKRRPLDLSALLNDDSKGCNDIEDDDVSWNGPYIQSDSMRLNRGASNDGKPIGANQAETCTKINESTYGLMKAVDSMDLKGTGASGGDITVAQHNSVKNYLSLPQEYDSEAELKIYITKVVGLNYYGNKCMVGVMASAPRTSATNGISKVKILMALKSNRDIRETDWDKFEDTTDGYYYADLRSTSPINYLFIPVAQTDCN
jgi:prepilin-type N-terminal cleavage/methylation domain-containing protein